MVEILKAAFTISESDAPSLAKVFWFGCFVAAVLIVAAVMGRL